MTYLLVSHLGGPRKPRAQVGSPSQPSGGGGLVCGPRSDVWIAGVNVGTPSTYTFSNIAANHTVRAYFVTQ
jgi:hypothetical protein